MDDTQEDSLVVTLDRDSVEIILEGLELLPLGRVRLLYDALKAAADQLWNESNAT